MVTYKNRAFREMISYFIGVYLIKRILHAAWRYEISLLVLKNISRVSALVKYFSTREEKFRISARPCNVLYNYLYLCEKKKKRKEIKKQIRRTILLPIIHFNFLFCTVFLGSTAFGHRAFLADVYS